MTSLARQLSQLCLRHLHGWSAACAEHACASCQPASFVCMVFCELVELGIERRFGEAIS
jgi:hypothetical protein